MDEIQKLSHRKFKLTHQIEKVCNAIDQDIAYLFEKFFESNSYAYFALEEKLLGMKLLFETLGSQVKETTILSDLTKVAERIGYVEDRLDEMESQIYRRRKRRQHSFRFSDFFDAYQKQMGSGPVNEVAALKRAYSLLGLTGEEPLFEVTATFRRLAKACHPDARGGDRSDEAKLRGIVDAYQYIKQHFNN